MSSKRQKRKNIRSRFTSSQTLRRESRYNREDSDDEVLCCEPYYLRADYVESPPSVPADADPEEGNCDGGATDEEVVTEIASRMSSKMIFTDQITEIEHSISNFKEASKMAPSDKSGLIEVDLISNIFPIELERGRRVYCYDVDVRMLSQSKPNDKHLQNDPHDMADGISLTKRARNDFTQLNRKLISRHVLNVCFEKYGLFDNGQSKVYDDVSILYTNADISEKLNESNGVFFVSVEEVQGVLGDLIKSTKTKQFKVVIKSSLTNIGGLSLSPTSQESSQSVTQFLELLTSQDSINRHSFTWYGNGRGYRNDLDVDVGYGYVMKHGVTKCAREIEGCKQDGQNDIVAVVIDDRKSFFYKSIPVLDAICEHNGWTKRIVSGDNSMWSDESLKKTDLFFRKLCLQFVDGSRSFICEGISSSPLNNCYDFTKKGEFPSAAKYHDSKTRIRYGHWPAMIESHYDPGSGFNRQIYHAMDGLIIAPNQRVWDVQESNIKAQAIELPKDRWDHIYTNMTEHYLNLRETGNEVMENFGVKVANECYKTKGYLLKFPKITYAEKVAIVNNVKLNWKHANRFEVPSRIDHLIFAWTECDEKVAVNTCHKLVLEARRKGVKIEEFLTVEINLERELRGPRIFKDAEERAKDGREVLLIYVDNAASKENHRLLKFLESKHQIVTQHLRLETIKGLSVKKQTCDLIVQKMNVKMGGLTYRVQPEEQICELLECSLIIGYDVTHPTGASRNRQLGGYAPVFPSVVGYSANVSVDADMFIGDFVYQDPLQEKVNHSVLVQIMTNLLRLRVQNRGELPKKLVIVRDGVSRGQYNMVIHEEIPAILEACDIFLNGYRPKILCMVVSKRHNTRFALNGSRGVENPPAAMVIDEDVVSSERTEFYLQSHTPLIGTVKIPFYTVLVSEIPGVTSETLENLMLNLAFQHQVCNSSISLPECVYQSDEWSKRGDELIRTFIQIMNLYPDLRSELKRTGGDNLDPTAPVDWNFMTRVLSYSGKRLEGKRVNA